MASQEINAYCSICGNGYHQCVSCKDLMALQPYKLHTDTAEHYKIYQILHGYNTGIYDIAEAKAKLQAVDLSDLNKFRDNIQITIGKIMTYEKPVEIKSNEVKPTFKKGKKKINKIVETEKTED